jgi:hypothetical protein
VVIRITTTYSKVGAFYIACIGDYALTETKGRMIRRSPSLAATIRRTRHSSFDYFWGDDAWARFMA